MMEGLNIGHFSVDSNGNLTELAKVKLSGKSQAFRGANSQGMVWAGTGLLAILTGKCRGFVLDLILIEPLVRFNIIRNID